MEIWIKNISLEHQIILILSQFLKNTPIFLQTKRTYFNSEFDFGKRVKVTIPKRRYDYGHVFRNRITRNCR